ncbi:putative inorganic phosphate cotransporter [Athalia rosae]|uniref:putative inorganic phosphate cotransporter n=1 Tax=Athalia rosae TaxID=37344 RepID=UPI002033F13A|nr:putative inorganic phosphate cotransporter [Athalia rosae]
MLSSLRVCCGPIRQRWVFALMGFLGIVNAYAMRNCLSLAITEMVRDEDHSEGKIDLTLCPANNQTTTSASGNGEFDWDETVQGVILSAFYWGYVVTHVPGGYLSERFGGKYVLALGIFSTAIFTLLTPIVITWGGSTALVVLRILMGLGEGTTFPALNFMLAQWTPPTERSRMGSMVFAGAQLGTVYASSISGILLDLYGWRSVFYFFGSVGVAWTLIFAIVCYSDPDSHPFISEKERKYLKESTYEHAHKKLPPAPWKPILKSAPVWALVVAQIGHDWGLLTIVTDLPLYMSNVLHFSIKSNGLLSALPYLAMWLVSIASSPIADWLINSGKMSIANVRKLFTTGGSMGPAVFIIAASYAGCDKTNVVILMTVGMGLMGTYYPGMRVNSLDLTINYSGTVMAVVSGIGAISGILTPYIVGILTPNETVGEWRLVFWIVFGVFTVTNAFYLFYASGDVQYWDDPEWVRETRDNKKHKAAAAVTTITTQSDS